MKKHFSWIIVLLAVFTVLISAPAWAQAVEEKGATKRPSNGTYVLHSALNNQKVLDISAASRSAGGNVQLWQWANVPQQKFLITNAGGSNYTIRPTHSNLYVGAARGGTRAGTNVEQQRKYYFDKRQQWYMEDAGNGYVYIRNAKSGLCLDAQNGTCANGNNVWLYPFNGSAAQKWWLEDLSAGPKTPWLGVRQNGAKTAFYWDGYAGARYELILEKNGAAFYKNANAYSGMSLTLGSGRYTAKVVVANYPGTPTSAVKSFEIALPTGIYLKQASRTSCTSAAATMMLRAKTYLDGGAWSDIKETDVWKSSLSNPGVNYNIRWSFGFRDYQVGHAWLSGSYEDKLAKIKRLIDENPEGIVIYNDYHALWAMEYSGDTIYGGDSWGNSAGKKMDLGTSPNMGYGRRGARAIISSMNAYWYIK